MCVCVFFLILSRIPTGESISMYSPIIITINLAAPKQKRSLFHQQKNKHSDISLPQKLKELVLHSVVLPSNFPTSLTHLTLSDDFNRPIDHSNLTSLPHITHLVFGNTFNQCMDHLPPTLVHLTYGHKFNQHIADNALPASLQHLIFGKKFNKRIDNKLPDTLETCSWKEIQQTNNNTSLISQTSYNWINQDSNSTNMNLTLHILWTVFHLPSPIYTCLLQFPPSSPQASLI
jgi:hypothetical protein